MTLRVYPPQKNKYFSYANRMRYVKDTEMYRNSFFWGYNNLIASLMVKVEKQ
jgi:hypothetical protein